MNTSIQSLKDQLESLAGVEDVEAYPADYDLSQPDIISVVGGVSEEITETIENALDDGEASLQAENGSYMLYQPLGVVDEHDGSKFDILAHTNSKIETVLVEQGPEEVASVGTVVTFDRDDTDYDTTLYNKAQ